MFPPTTPSSKAKSHTNHQHDTRASNSRLYNCMETVGENTGGASILASRISVPATSTVSFT